MRYLALLLLVSPLPAQRLLFSTFTHQHGSPTAVAVDAAGNVYVAGTIKFRPEYETPTDIFVAKFSGDGRRVIYNRYIGGSGPDSVTGLVVDNEGNAYLAGTTSSPDFPITAGAWGRTPTGSSGGTFALKLDSSGDRILFATFLGSPSYRLAGFGLPKIALDSAGNLVISRPSG